MVDKCELDKWTDAEWIDVDQDTHVWDAALSR